VSQQILKRTRGGFGRRVGPHQCAGHSHKSATDVLELLDAASTHCALKCSTWTASTILVGRVTGVVVRETVPASFLKRADRWSTWTYGRRPAGTSAHRKIYAADKVPWARTLLHRGEPDPPARAGPWRGRESVERSSFARTPLVSRASEQAPPQPRDGVHVVQSTPCGHVACAGLSRLAGRLNTTGSWFGKPQRVSERIAAEVQRHLLANIEKARELGAEVGGCAPRIRWMDPDFARSHSVGHIIVGRSHWRGEADAGTIGALRWQEGADSTSTSCRWPRTRSSGRDLQGQADFGPGPLAIALAWWWDLATVTTRLGEETGQIFVDNYRACVRRKG